MILNNILMTLFGLGFVYFVICLLRELFRKDVENDSKVKQALKVGAISWIAVFMLASSYTFYKNKYSTWIDVIVSLLVQATLLMPVGFGMFISMLSGWVWHDKLREINKKIIFNFYSARISTVNFEKTIYTFKA